MPGFTVAGVLQEVVTSPASVYFEEDFTATLDGTMAGQNAQVNETGLAWRGDTGSMVYDPQGRGVECTAGGSAYVLHRTNARMDVQQTMHFTISVGSAPGRVNGRLLGRGEGVTASGFLMLTWVPDAGATGGYDVRLVDVSSNTILHTWEIETLAERVVNRDDIEVVVRWSGDQVVLHSLKVNAGPVHAIGDAYTLEGIPLAQHGPDSGHTDYGFGNLERIVSSTWDRVRLYRVESIPAG